MDGPFAHFAFSLALRDASFVALAAGTLMVAFSFDPPLALVIGAHVALFSPCSCCSGSPPDRGARERTEPWHGLEPDERPGGDAALADARRGLQDSLLRIAKSPRGLPARSYVVDRDVVELRRRMRLHWIVTGHLVPR